MRRRPNPVMPLLDGAATVVVLLVVMIVVVVVVMVDINRNGGLRHLAACLLNVRDVLSLGREQTKRNAE